MFYACFRSPRTTHDRTLTDTPLSFTHQRQQFNISSCLEKKFGDDQKNTIHRKVNNSRIEFVVHASPAEGFVESGLSLLNSTATLPVSRVFSSIASFTGWEEICRPLLSRSVNAAKVQSVVFCTYYNLSTFFFFTWNTLFICPRALHFALGRRLVIITFVH